MPAFNPTPQITGPGPVAEFKGITPAPDESMATLIKGIATVGGLAVNAADEVVKEDIKNKAYTASELQRDSFTGNLETALTKVGKGLGKTLGIVSDDGDVPDGVKQGLDQVTTLQSANGKISTMQYWGRLTATAKDLRSQYPGYREYIDEQMQKITGHNPANQYLSALSTDLNRAAAGSSDSFSKKLESTFLSDDVRGIVGAPEALSKFRATGDTAGAYAWLSKQQESIAANKKAHADITLGNLQREAKATAGQAAEIASGTQTVLNALDTFTMHIEGGKDAQGKQLPPTDKRVLDHLEDLKRSGKLADPENARLIGAAIAGKRNEIETSLDKDWSQVIAGTQNADGTGGETKFSRMGPEKSKAAKELILNSWDRASNLIYNQNYGDAFALKSATEAKIDKASAGMVTDVNLAEHTTALAAGRRMLGEQAAGVLTQEAYSKGFGKALGTYFHSNALKMVTQPNTSFGGPPKTFNDVIEGAKNTPARVGLPTNAAGDQKTDTTKKTEAEFVKTVLKQINIITDPSVKDDQAKLNVAQAAFSKENSTMLNQFVLENRDPVTGKIADGQHAVFKQFTSPAITNEIFRLSKEHPEVWDNYKNWVTHSWGRILFRNDILQMNNVASNPEVRIGWNTETQQWTEPQHKYNPNQQIHLDTYALLHFKDQVRLVNDSLTSLKNMYAAEGQKEISPLILKAFLDADVKLQKMPVNMTSELMKALILGNKTPQDAPGSPSEPRTLDKKTEVVPTPTPTENNAPVKTSDISHYTSEDGSYTMAQFLANPALLAGNTKPRFVKKGAKPDSTNLGDVLSIDFGPIEHTKNGKVIRTEPGRGVVTP